MSKFIQKPTPKLITLVNESKAMNSFTIPFRNHNIMCICTSPSTMLSDLKVVLHPKYCLHAILLLAM
jgi:hypothetical protein